MNVDLVVIAGILLLLSVLLVRYFFRIAILMVLAGVLMMYTGITVGDLRKIFSDSTSVDQNGNVPPSSSSSSGTESLVVKSRRVAAATMGSSNSHPLKTNTSTLKSNTNKNKNKTSTKASLKTHGARNHRPREGMNGAPWNGEPAPAPHQPFPAPRIFGEETPQTSRMVKSYGEGEYSTRAAPPSMPVKEQRELAIEAAKTHSEVHKWEQSRLLPLTAAPARRTFNSDYPPVYHHI